MVEVLGNTLVKENNQRLQTPHKQFNIVSKIAVALICLILAFFLGYNLGTKNSHTYQATVIKPVQNKNTPTPTQLTPTPLQTNAKDIDTQALLKNGQDIKYCAPPWDYNEQKPIQVFECVMLDLSGGFKKTVTDDSANDINIDKTLYTNNGLYDQQASLSAKAKAFYNQLTEKNTLHWLEKPRVLPVGGLIPTLTLHAYINGNSLEPSYELFSHYFFSYDGSHEYDVVNGIIKQLQQLPN